TISTPLAGYFLAYDDLRKEEVRRKLFPKTKIESIYAAGNVRAQLCELYECDMLEILHEGQHCFVLIPPGAVDHDHGKQSPANKVFGEKLENLGLPVRWVHMLKPDIRC
ncbi:hypothetical protein FRC09_004267, partial [Ceratobasidium sp. 395]